MKSQLRKTLYRVVEDVMEKLAFILSFPEDIDEESVDKSDFDSSATAVVSFSGTFTGKLLLAISEDMLPELAGNMLGFDDGEETTTEQRHDALCELINVICGNLLPAIAGKELLFTVNPPSIIDKDQFIQQIEKEKAASFVRLPLEEGQCDLFLFIDGELPVDLLTKEDA